MSTLTPTQTDPTVTKARRVLSLEGNMGQAGEVVLSQTNQPGSPRVFQTAVVTVDGPYSFSVTTEDTYFLSIRPEGDVVVQAGATTGTTARFTVSRVDAFEYGYSASEMRFTFVERRPAGDIRLSLTISR